MYPWAKHSVCVDPYLETSVVSAQDCVGQSIPPLHYRHGLLCVDQYLCYTPQHLSPHRPWVNHLCQSERRQVSTQLHRLCLGFGFLHYCMGFKDHYVPLPPISHGAKGSYSFLGCFFWGTRILTRGKRASCVRLPSHSIFPQSLCTC